MQTTKGGESKQTSDKVKFNTLEQLYTKLLDQAKPLVDLLNTEEMKMATGGEE